MKNAREERRQDCDEKAVTSRLKKILQDFLQQTNSITVITTAYMFIV